MRWIFAAFIIWASGPAAAAYFETREQCLDKLRGAIHNYELFEARDDFIAEEIDLLPENLREEGQALVSDHQEVAEIMSGIVNRFMAICATFE